MGKSRKELRRQKLYLLMGEWAIECEEKNFYNMAIKVKNMQPITNRGVRNYFYEAICDGEEYYTKNVLKAMEEALDIR